MRLVICCNLPFVVAYKGYVRKNLVRMLFIFFTLFADIMCDLYIFVFEGKRIDFNSGHCKDRIGCLPDSSLSCLFI